MRTFLETSLNRSKSFLLYGNLEDKYISSDLVIRNFEHYILRLLKSRGYRYVIFYGGSGARGAYCIDGESARFFFSENRHLSKIPVVDGSFDSRSSKTTNNPEAAQLNTEGDPTADLTGSDFADSFKSFDDPDEDGYVPGNLPYSISEEAEAMMNSASADSEQADTAPQEPAVQTGAEQTSAPNRVCYEKKEMSEVHFFEMVHPHLSDRKNKIAVVFYNIQATDLNSPILKDDVTYIMEVDDRKSICLFCVPGSQYNDEKVYEELTRNGLQGKFTLKQGNGRITNPVNCIRICQPDTDEIANLLRYFHILGTASHNKITFDYSRINQLADRILYAVAKRKSVFKEDVGNLKDILETMSDYIDENCKPGAPLSLTLEEIDKIWGITYEKGKALKTLQKRGWENVYEAVCQALKQAQSVFDRNSELTAEKPEIDWGINRFRSVKKNERSNRPGIPNFLIMGPPGVGKSTMARLIGEILQENGILKKGHTHEVGKANLVNSFVAGIPGQTLSQVDAAEEGVLFIDEIHELGVKDGGVNNDGSGKEVVSTLNQAVTDPNRHFCLIGAGYASHMQPLIDLDPGFKDRFDFIIEIESYTPDILYTILMENVHKMGYSIAPDITEEKTVDDTHYIPLMCMLHRLYDERDRETFRNAQVIEKIASYAIAKCHDKKSAAGAVQSKVITEDCFYKAYENKIDGEWFKPGDVQASLDTIMKELDERFVGMQKAKAAVRRIGQKLMDFEANNTPASEMRVKPMLFVGNPGTGKTELAKLLPKLLYRYHVVGTSKPMIVSASTLASTYRGGSTEKTIELIKKAQARKAFLFVDECNTLLETSIDGKGVLQALLDPLTDETKPFVLALALYPSNLEAFYKMDKGLKRRFNVIMLDDYTGDELFEILIRNIKKSNLRTNSDTDNILRQVMNKAYLKRGDDDGNGGFAGNLLEEMDGLRRDRCIRDDIPLDSPESRELLIEDIPENLRKGMVVEEPKNVSERLNRLLDNFSHEVVGMQSVRHELRMIALEVQDALANGKKPSEVKLRSIILVGNPGVGKTKVAKIIPEIYENFGVLNQDEPIVINGAELKSGIAQNGGELSRKIKEAQKTKSMLFVDEAHNLIDGGESIFKLFMEPTTDKENPLFACFALYPKFLDSFLSMDDGSDSRFRIIRLDDYTGDELLDIFRMMISAKNLSADDEVLRILRQHFAKVANGANSTTGNGRYVEKYIEIIDRNRMERCDREGIPFSDGKSRILVAEDIPEEDRRHFIADTGSKVDRLIKMKETIRNERIGFPLMKNILCDKIDDLIYREMYPKRANEKSYEPGHYFFLGKPGTGKTTCAEYIAKYFYDMGIINDPVPKIIKASDLIGTYLGHSEHNTKQQLNRARGKLLMIDEAYALVSDSLSGNEYKDAAVNEIIGVLDDKEFRKNTCVVFAGYADDLRKLYEMNSGFNGRVTEIEFEDYTLDELVTILKSILGSSGIRLNEESELCCREKIAEMMLFDSFANGRTIRRFADLLSNRLHKRCIREHYDEGDRRVTEIQVSDIPDMNELEKLLNL